jgi:hypothetical protein
VTQALQVKAGQTAVAVDDITHRVEASLIKAVLEQLVQLLDWYATKAGTDLNGHVDDTVGHAVIV